LRNAILTKALKEHTENFFFPFPVHSRNYRLERENWRDQKNWLTAIIENEPAKFSAKTFPLSVNSAEF